ncbi:MAG: DUF2281 domain-containing protein [Aphanizomenon flos-aquae Clear-A1]|jgi:hypothetical protein|uniref:DUF2281 domain-containing protein n=1 Tax=Dolichospermum sp. FACHB-1091 TaxID=2692798 RepID=UPI0016801FA6|nr:DUF2281 domain-containing protein [Dolichospermum sp. FACHB-1091]MBD1216181.1 DUF2281 domain-containing protein [Aphanizomenon flos-aquae Clear-A1]MBD2442436.1 DUF2281 domain-containing protein [Dolichospermum sp. FACHB-1091]NTW18952.1 DUF2281 domain-containing protein [Nostocales cyanobacterium W4_Combined_metabat2_030]
MTIEQAVLENLRELPTDKQQEVLDFIQFLKHKLPPNKPTFNPDGENFWEMTLRFRERMEREGIEFTDDDFANLRDRSPGREVEL